MKRPAGAGLGIGPGLRRGDTYLMFWMVCMKSS